MAHVVLASTSEAIEGPKKKSRQGIKEEHLVDSNQRKEEARDRVELERKRVREGEIAKKRLRVLATQRCKTEQETVEALEQINQMSPEDALRNLDLHLARAEAGFADKMAISIRDGVGSILDRVLRADGCIAARFRSDHALQSALTNELGYIATFVSNKAVIALSAASDVVGGYQDSLSLEGKESSSRSAGEEPKNEEAFSLVLIEKQEEKQEKIQDARPPREAADEEQAKQKKRRIKNHV